MKAKNKDLTSLDEFINDNIGKTGTPKREQFENEYGKESKRYSLFDFAKNY